MIFTTTEYTRQKEIERVNGARPLNYKIELYKRYTEKDPDAIIYNGFVATFPDGSKDYYTIHYRTDNTRPYAIYINGSQTRHKTYIKRFYCEKILKQERNIIQAYYKGVKTTDIYGKEIIT